MNRDPQDIARDLAVPVLAVAVAVIIGGLMLALTGANPFPAYSALVSGSMGSTTAVARTLIKATPLILTGLSVTIAFRAGLFNIGGTGQVVVGMLAGGWCALNFGGLPQIVHIPFELLCAAIAGGVWAGIAGWAKASRGANEVVTTIMLNYVAIRLGELLLSTSKWGLLQDHGNANPQSHAFTASAGFPILWQADPFNAVHFGLVVALAAGLGLWFLIDRTTLGYRIRAVGLNAEAAEYGGIDVRKTLIIAMIVAGILAGLAGVGMSIGDPPALLSKSDFSVVAQGFTGIAVALLGRNKASGVIVGALLFGALQSGAVQVQFSGGLEPGVATKLIDIVQGLIIFFVAMDVLFRQIATRIFPKREAQTAPPARTAPRLTQAAGGTT